MSKVKNVFITGANRGLGFNLVKEMISVLHPEKIFATYRDADKAQELFALASKNSTVHPIQLDVQKLTNIDDVIKTVDKITNGAGINLLINNAGVQDALATLADVKKEKLMENLEINVVAPILVTQAFLPLLEKASAASSAPLGIGRAAVVNMSSRLGSIGETEAGGPYAIYHMLYPYKSSKAALNMATKIMSIEFGKSKIIAVAMHPGWVQTDMGGEKAPMTPQQSVQGMVKVLESLNESHNGKFVQHNGEVLVW